MKTIGTILLAGILLVSLAGCANNTADSRDAAYMEVIQYLYLNEGGAITDDITYVAVDVGDTDIATRNLKSDVERYFSESDLDVRWTTFDTLEQDGEYVDGYLPDGVMIRFSEFAEDSDTRVRFNAYIVRADKNANGGLFVLDRVDDKWSMTPYSQGVA